MSTCYISRFETYHWVTFSNAPKDDFPTDQRDDPNCIFKHKNQPSHRGLRTPDNLSGKTYDPGTLSSIKTKSSLPGMNDVTAKKKKGRAQLGIGPSAASLKGTQEFAIVFEESMEMAERIRTY